MGGGQFGTWIWIPTLGTKKVGLILNGPWESDVHAYVI